MAEIKTGGNAFPIPGDQQDETFNGMTLRDYFAAKALQGLLAADAICEFKPEGAAESAYKFADSMIAAREGGAK